MSKKWISASKKQKVAETCRYSCAYCGGLLNDDTLMIDHITPRSKGGKNNMDNLLPCCRACNSSKGAKTLEEFRLFKSFTQKVSDLPFNQKQIEFLFKKGAFPLFGIVDGYTFHFEANQ